jgi:adenylate cyclase
MSAPGANQTFLFADLAGFTALTEAHGDQEAADLVGDFCEQVGGMLGDYDAEQIKALGDALMLRVPDAGQAVRLGLRVVHEVGLRPGFPVVRAGMHSGPAVARNGDWFGATVNLAARVSSAAAGGEVLLTEATRAAAGELEGVDFLARGPHAFRNVGDPIRVFTAVSDEMAGSLPIDPVCRMAVDPAHQSGVLIHDNAEYHFCSLPCAEAFAREPGRYARS